jgi:hypothetical protein
LQINFIPVGLRWHTPETPASYWQSLAKTMQLSAWGGRGLPGNARAFAYGPLAHGDVFIRKNSHKGFRANPSPTKFSTQTHPHTTVLHRCQSFLHAQELLVQRCGQNTVPLKCKQDLDVLLEALLKLQEHFPLVDMDLPASLVLARLHTPGTCPWVPKNRP